MDTIKRISLGVLAILALVVAAAGGARADAYKSPDGLADGGIVIGNPNAPITIIEYASMTCPHCAHFATTTLPKLKEAWVDTGKARLIFREFPFDRPALMASVLARCAGPERAMGFIEVLFQEQRTWATSPDPAAALAQIGKLGGVGQEQYDACLADKALAQSIVQTRLDGEKTYGIDSTPTFIVNGKKLEGGALSFEEFDAVLKKINPGS
jgi:protein-disulfide isomerase